MICFNVESIGNFIDFAYNDMRTFFKRPIFRGQRNNNWRLQANLFRENNRIPWDVTLHFLSWCKKNSLFYSFNDEVLLQVAQHYGLLTDLLDFSKNPLIACYFALCPEKKNDSVKEVENAAVYVVDAEMLDNIELLALDIQYESIKNVITNYQGMYREGMAIGLSRLTAQEGVFVRDANGTLESVLNSENEIFGLEYEDRFKRRLNYAKLILPNSDSNRYSLSKLGICRELLFPPTNYLEREFEKFLISYPDKLISDLLLLGINL